VSLRTAMREADGQSSNHEMILSHITKRKFKQWWSTINNLNKM